MSINTDKLMNDIINLNKVTDNKHMLSEELLSEIITPEWYYSDSQRIFENTSISWDSLLRSEFTNNMSLNENRSTIMRRDIVFEKSFCTWYQPYHLLPRTKWGIHIRSSSWMIVASQLNKECPHLISKLDESTVAAFLYIYLHMAFHYLVENAISTMELSTKNPSFYNDYYINNYLKTFNTPACKEESLANAYLYENASECHIDREYLKKELINQGDAYADFLKYTDNNNFFNGCQELIYKIKNEHKDLIDYEFENLEYFFNLRSLKFILQNQIPIWLHHKPKPIH
ncbi:MAG TPA: hypothetical protein VF222_13010 [Nitrososphaeraceae archaeon]